MISVEELAQSLLFLNYGLPQTPGLSQKNIKAYHIVLSEFTDEQVRQGVLRVLETWDRATIYPPPATIRAACLDIMAEVQGVPNAEAAWMEIVTKLRQFGSQGHIPWNHSLVADAVDAMGGQRYLATSPNMVAERAHFLKMYPKLRHNAVVGGLLKLESSRKTKALLERGPNGQET